MIVLIVGTFDSADSEQKNFFDFYPLESHIEFAHLVDGETYKVILSIFSNVIYRGAVEDLLADIDPEEKDFRAFLENIDTHVKTLEDKTHDARFIYSYSYKFRNKGKIPVRILLVHDGLIWSPLTNLQGDFAITLQPMETWHGVFLANGTPQSGGALLFHALQKKGTAQWEVAGAAGIALYIPERFAFFFSLGATRTVEEEQKEKKTED